MKKISIQKVLSVCCAVIFGCSFVGCQKTVILAPGEDDLIVLNGCVVSACNYLAAVKAQNMLDRNFWARILLVRFTNHPGGHAYCVWETDGTIYGYDRNAGAFPIPVYTRDPRAIAIVLAQELGKVMQAPLSVSQADFVDSKEAKLFTFDSIADATSPPPPTLLANVGAFSLVDH